MYGRDEKLSIAYSRMRLLTLNIQHRNSKLAELHSVGSRLLRVPHPILNTRRSLSRPRRQDKAMNDVYRRHERDDDVKRYTRSVLPLTVRNNDVSVSPPIRTLLCNCRQDSHSQERFDQSQHGISATLHCTQAGASKQEATIHQNISSDIQSIYLVLIHSLVGDC